METPEYMHGSGGKREALYQGRTEAENKLEAGVKQKLKRAHD